MSVVCDGGKSKLESVLRGDRPRDLLEVLQQVRLVGLGVDEAESGLSGDRHGVEDLELECDSRRSRCDAHTRGHWWGSEAREKFVVTRTKSRLSCDPCRGPSPDPFFCTVCPLVVCGFENSVLVR